MTLREESISLVISTFNWPRALELVLGSVRRQRSLPGEVIVADDGSGDETRSLIEREARTFAVPLVHVWHENRGFRLAAIRNKAIATTQGEYIVQIDGDIMLHPGFIREHARRARRGAWVQGSRALLGRRCTEALLRGKRRMPGVLTGDMRNRLNAVHFPVLSDFVRGVRDDSRRIRGAHMAFWREDLIRVNGYDEQMDGWGLEDTELAARLLHAGVRRRNIKFSAVAYHLWHESANRIPGTLNRGRLERTRALLLTRTECGLDRHLGAAHPKPPSEPAAATGKTGPA